MLSLLVRVFFCIMSFFLLMRDNGPAYSRAPCQHVPPSLLTAGTVVAGALPALVQYNKYSNTYTHTHTSTDTQLWHTLFFPTHLNLIMMHTLLEQKHTNIWSLQPSVYTLACWIIINRKLLVVMFTLKGVCLIIDRQNYYKATYNTDKVWQTAATHT